MARAGLCSRRTAETWIGGGRVALNGALVTDPAVNVGAADKITVDGEPLARRVHTRLFLFHKPRGLVSTERDPEGRPTIFDYLREHWPEGPRVVSIGRLDINTEGLLLLTNDGGLARVLELPSTGWVRRYRARAKGETDQSVLDRLREGVTIDGVAYAGIEATLDREQGANSWMTLALREGKNREIKRVLEHFGLIVNRLIRLSFGPFQLGELAEGVVEEVRMRVLRDQLGPSLAKAAGVDFSSPAAEPSEAPDPIESRRPARVRTSGGPNRERSPARDARGTKPRETKPRDKRAPERSPPAEARAKPRPGPRKHISALRAEESVGQSGARKRIERRETEDRSGRTVQVERLVSADAGRARREKSPAPATRNGRRFEAERKSRDGETARPARRSGASANRSANAAEESGERRQKRWDKAGGYGARAPAGKRLQERPRVEERPRSARPKVKPEGGGPARASRPSADARPLKGGRPSGKGGPARGSGPGKGRPRDKR